jgi:DNA-binding NarL/FixJ family response regulator
MKILILEDNPIRIEQFRQLLKNQELTITDTVSCAEELCKQINYDIMFLDHDLGCRIWVDSQEENTGYQFVKWLVEISLQRKALIYIHSMNPVGANKMLNLLLDNGYDGIWVPFPQLKI